MNTNHAPIEKTTAFGIIATAAAGLILAAVAIPAVIGSSASDEQPLQVAGTSVTAGSSASTDDVADRAALLRRLSDILDAQPSAIPVVAHPGTTAGRGGSGASRGTSTWPTGTAQAGGGSTTTTCGSPSCTWTTPAPVGGTTTAGGASSGSTGGGTSSSAGSTGGTSSSAGSSGGTGLGDVVTGTTSTVTTTVNGVVGGLGTLLGG